MKKVIIALSMLLASCSGVNVPGDQEAVLVTQPWFFGHGGISDEPVTTGREYCAWTTDAIYFTITPVKYEHKFDDMVTADHIPIDFSAFITLSPRRGKTPSLLKTGGVNWYTQQVDQEFTSTVRDRASGHNMYELCSNRHVLQNIADSVQKHMVSFLAEKGLEIDVHDVTIGAATPPEEVLEETRRTAAQEQNKLTQVARASAEDARKQAEINKAISDDAYRSKMTMTMEQYLQLRQLEIEKEKIELVREKTNVSIIMGDRVQPMYNVK